MSEPTYFPKLIHSTRNGKRRLPGKRTQRRHLGRYASWPWEGRYRICLVCGKVMRNYGMKPLLKNGGKP